MDLYYLNSGIRDWSLITRMGGGGGGLQNGRGGGHMKFYPYDTGGGGHKMFWGSFYMVA